MRNNGQTSMEFVILIGAVMLFVVAIALAVQSNVFAPAKNETESRGSEINESLNDYENLTVVGSMGGVPALGRHSSGLAFGLLVFIHAVFLFSARATRDLNARAIEFKVKGFRK
ncbi:hypothetical protein AUJ65_01130 [Candidatus Micrarchaeota archaeon CG1_02_51_15]|nr:MAG: hypothetical protein AUJ65_01130 [Candidatus Micrarchaeota archaeon CG1_02_51_15]